MEVIKLLFCPLQAELATPWQKDQIMVKRVQVGTFLYVVFASVHLKNVVKKRSSVQACLRWGHWLIQVFTESKEEVRRAANTFT